jgi:hypothetical protein
MTTLTKAERKAEFLRIAREAEAGIHTSFLAGYPEDAPPLHVLRQQERASTNLPMPEGRVSRVASLVASSSRSVVNKVHRIELPTALFAR